MWHGDPKITDMKHHSNSNSNPLLKKVNASTIVMRSFGRARIKIASIHPPMSDHSRIPFKSGIASKYIQSRRPGPEWTICNRTMRSHVFLWYNLRASKKDSLQSQAINFNKHAICVILDGKVWYWKHCSATSSKHWQNKPLGIAWLLTSYCESAVQVLILLEGFLRPLQISG